MNRLFSSFARFALALSVWMPAGLCYDTAFQESGQPASGQHQGPGGQSEGGRPSQMDEGRKTPGEKRTGQGGARDQSSRRNGPRHDRKRQKHGRTNQTQGPKHKQQ